MDYTNSDKDIILEIEQYMNDKGEALISRMKYISRWALMRNTHQENISEHSLEVASIAHALALIHNKRFGGSVNAERAAVLFNALGERANLICRFDEAPKLSVFLRLFKERSIFFFKVIRQHIKQHVAGIVLNLLIRRLTALWRNFSKATALLLTK